MIQSVSSDKPTFRTIYFKPGFNVILAERTKESTKKDSRNGLGKSTLIEIIHFCLGGNKGETLSKKEMNNWTFSIELNFLGSIFSISRNTYSGNKIIIAGDFSILPEKPDYDKKNDFYFYSRDHWNILLGNLLFGLPIVHDETMYRPTFRSLISYFIRKNGHSGAFLNPFQHNKNQREWDMQVNNAFLLGLNWKYASKLQVLKDRKKVINQIKIEAKSGMLSALMGTIGELEAHMIRLEDQIKKDSSQLSNFIVHPQYSDIELESNELTKKITELANENVLDKNFLDNYEESLTGGMDIKEELIRKIYSEAGLYFPENVTKRIEDVLEFHKKVIKNRKDFLEIEIKRLQEKIISRENEKEDIDKKRSKLMGILKNHGALEAYNKLQNRHQEKISELHSIKLKIENLKRFEEGKSALFIDMEFLFKEAKVEISQRQKQKEDAILFFNKNSQTLYDVPGTLSIDIEKSGYKYKVDIERSGSHGIGNMKIFCYDLMLAKLWADKKQSPRLLIHDSILFADVDERQKAHAIELAAKESEKLGFQYICALNSDNLPNNDFSQDFDLNKFVCCRFTDATENGGLLGVRF